ncbi:hypothetical protein NKJ70_16950 [Mesorhizobium sp. M0092]|uniref:hypothetical protein n=1 Tax=unclassified Mesorhizobium TaxID=325217 RepID=UPI0033389FB2
MSKRQDRQRLIRHYRDVSGEPEIDMHKVAEFAKTMGWKMPTPPSEVELLARQFADDAQAERKHDKKTGKPYRVYHALPASGQTNLFVYIDIDEASRNQMLKSAVNRREQMVSDGYNLTLDLDHWNNVNPELDPINLPMDLGLDIEIRKASDDEPGAEAA